MVLRKNVAINKSNVLVVGWIEITNLKLKRYSRFMNSVSLSLQFDCADVVNVFDTH